MLSLSLRRAGCARAVMPLLCTQIRKAHRAPDFKFLQEANYKRFDNRLYPNRNCYGEPVIRSACEKMSLFPKLMQNAINTSAAMVAQDCVPFFHGEPSGLNAIRIFRNTLVHSKQDNQYYKYFRSTSAAHIIERSELNERIKKYIADNGIYKSKTADGLKFSTIWGDPLLTPLDVNPHLRPHLLSVSYAMTANVSKYDSCYWFTFHPRNPVDKINDVFAIMATRSLRARGHSVESIAEVIHEMRSIFNEYAELKVGTLMVIGVPRDKLSLYVYDSKSMGHPTDKNIHNVVNKPFEESTSRIMGKDGGLQARLMLYKETMTPRSGIKVIIANDNNEVEEYCSGLDIENPHRISTFDPLLYRKNTSTEEEDSQKRRALDARVAAIAKRFCK